MARFDDLPHDEQLVCLAELATAALASYGIEAAPPALINLSENATYRVEDAASGRRWAMRVHREGYHSRAAIASELAWLQALRRDGVVVTPVPVAGTGRRPDPVGRPSDHGAAAPCRAVRMGERRGAVGEGSSHRQVPHPRRGDGADASPLAGLDAAGRLRAVDLGFRHEPWRDAALGLMARRHGPRRGQDGAVRRDGRADRPAAAALRQGARTLRPDPLRHAARQPPHRRRRGEGARFRRFAASPGTSTMPPPRSPSSSTSRRCRS